MAKLELYPQSAWFQDFVFNHHASGLLNEVPMKSDPRLQYLAFQYFPSPYFYSFFPDYLALPSWFLVIYFPILYLEIPILPVSSLPLTSPFVLVRFQRSRPWVKDVCISGLWRKWPQGYWLMTTRDKELEESGERREGSQVTVQMQSQA